MLTETHTTGISSISVSRTSKGDYTYDIKIYHSGKGRAPFAAINRVDEMRKDLEKRLGIAGCPVEGEAPGTACPLAENIAAALAKVEAAEVIVKRMEAVTEAIGKQMEQTAAQMEKAEEAKTGRKKVNPEKEQEVAAKDTTDEKKKGNAPKKTE